MYFHGTILTWLTLFHCFWSCVRLDRLFKNSKKQYSKTSSSFEGVRIQTEGFFDTWQPGKGYQNQNKTLASATKRSALVVYTKF
jgi:hypothetical protein